MSKFIIAVSFLLIAAPALALVRPSPIVHPCSTFTCVADPDPSSSPASPAVTSSGASGSHYQRSPEEWAWNESQIDFSKVQLKNGLIKVSANYYINPQFISWGGYRLALKVK